MPDTSSFPDELDVLPRPLGDTNQNDSDFQHDVVHRQLADCIEKIEAEIGASGSGSGSLRERIEALEGSGTPVSAKLEDGHLYWKFSDGWFAAVPRVGEGGYRFLDISQTPQGDDGPETAKFEDGNLYFKFSGVWFQAIPSIGDNDVRHIRISDTSQA